MPTPTTFSGLVGAILSVIGVVIPAIFGVLFLYIVWKIIDAWVINAGDEKKRAEGKVLAVTAVLVIVLMLSTWGIVNLIVASLP